MDFRKIFKNEVIREIHSLSPGYEDHSSDVWLVKTDRREVVVRASGVTDSDKGIFWDGCRMVFGINPMHESISPAVLHG